MDEAWKITVWGVRGSAPRPSPDCMEYGGNTVCISLEQGGRLVILDAGTGLTALGQTLRGKTGVKRIDILLSHFHMDHVLGLYFFAPLFDPDAEIHFYGGRGMEEYLNVLVGPPFWPLKWRDFPARLDFHEIGPETAFALEGVSVSALAGNHPGGSLLYRLEGGGRRLTYGLDCEADGADLSALTEFAYESNLLIWDANFTRSDLCPGWGHSAWEQGAELGRAAKAGKVLMTHYNWAYTDDFLRVQERQAGSDGLCCFAKEGMVMAL